MIRTALSRLLFWVLKNKQLSSHEVACLAISALKDSNMNIEDRSLCTSALLEGLNALPLGAILTYSEQGNLLINNIPIDVEKARQLRESAKVLLSSQARALVKEQVTYAAIEMGVHKAVNVEQTLFLKSALWYIQQEEQLYKGLSNDNS